jgi:hypothetical protein
VTWRAAFPCVVGCALTGAACSSSPSSGATCPSAASPTSCATASDSPKGTCGSFDAVFALSDYTSSEVGLFRMTGGSMFAGGEDLGADPALASSAGRNFWIARDLGQIIELDTSCLRPIQTFDALDPNPDCSPPSPTDPYDVAVAPDGSLWIARFDVPTVLVLNPCGSRRMTVDLSALDSDGNPNMNSIRILDPAQPSAQGTMETAKAYVSLEILDDDSDPPLQSTRPSKLARISLNTGEVDDVLTLAGRNPLSSMVQLGSELYLADAGSWCNARGGMPPVCPAGQPDAGVELVDTRSFTSKLLVTGAALGGHASELAVTASCGVVIVAGELPATPTSLVQFDPTGASAMPLGTLIPSTGAFTLGGLAWDGDDVLLVGNGGTAGEKASVSVFTADSSSGCTLSQQPGESSLPMAPISFASLR